jgi:ABC-2 type transport system permease protein
MIRVLAVTKRLLRQFRNDKRTLVMVFGAPLLVLGLLSLVFDSGEYSPRIGVVGGPPPLAQALTNAGARVSAVTLETGEAGLRDGSLDAVLSFTGPRQIALRIEGGDPTVTKAVMLALHRTEKAMTPGPHIEPELSFLHGSATMSAFDNFGPVLVGFLVFFFVFMISGIAFVRERTTGTLERTLATPIRRWELVLGYALAFAVLVIVQAALIAAASVYLYGMLLAGSFAWLLVITLLLAISAMTVGMLLSAFAQSEFQLIQFIPIVIVPQIFFSGLFQMETMHPALQALGRVLPLTYGAHGMREVMIRGGGFSEIATDLAVLIIFPAVCLAANVLALKKVRAL